MATAINYSVMNGNHVAESYSPPFSHNSSRWIYNELSWQKELRESALTPSDQKRLMISERLMDCFCRCVAYTSYAPVYCFTRFVPENWRDASVIQAPVVISMIGLGLLSGAIASPLWLAYKTVSPQSKIEDAIDKHCAYLLQSILCSLKDCSTENKKQLLESSKDWKWEDWNDLKLQRKTWESQWYPRIAEWAIAYYLQTATQSKEQFCPIFLSQCKPLADGTTLDQLSEKFQNLASDEKQKLLLAIRQLEKSDLEQVQTMRSQIQSFAAQIQSSPYFRRICVNEIRGLQEILKIKNIREALGL